MTHLAHRGHCPIVLQRDSKTSPGALCSHHSALSARGVSPVGSRWSGVELADARASLANEAQEVAARADQRARERLEGEWLDLKAGAKQFRDRDLIFGGIPSCMRGMKYYQGPFNTKPMIIKLRTNGKIFLLGNKRQLEVRMSTKAYVVYNILNLRRSFLPGINSLKRNRSGQTKQQATQFAQIYF